METVTLPVYTRSLAHIQKQSRILRNLAAMAQRVAADYFGAGNADTEVFYEAHDEIAIRVFCWAGDSNEYRFKLKSDIETEFKNALSHDYAN